MKILMKNYLFSLIMILSLTVLSALILTSLYYFNLIDSNLNKILTGILGFLIFLISGLFFGYKTNNKALLKSLIFSIVFLIISVTFNIINKNTFDLESVLNIVIKFLVFPIGSIIGINLK